MEQLSLFPSQGVCKFCTSLVPEDKISYSSVFGKQELKNELHQLGCYLCKAPFKYYAPLKLETVRERWAEDSAEKFKIVCVDCGNTCWEYPFKGAWGMMQLLCNGRYQDGPLKGQECRSTYTPSFLPEDKNYEKYWDTIRQPEGGFLWVPKDQAILEQVIQAAHERALHPKSKKRNHSG